MQHTKPLILERLLGQTKKSFEAISKKMDERNGISLSDCLLSGLAIFGLKYPSLLQFDNDRNNEAALYNLKTLYKINQVPSDTYLRERLDEVTPLHLRKAFTKAFAFIQRGKVLKPYVFMEDHYLVSIDGTGIFSSKNIHCESCCVNNHKAGYQSYHHKMVAAVLVHPDHKEVFPFAPEAITKQDGTVKNDCEQLASARLLTHLRREHPHLKMIIVEDSLAANGPHIRKIQSLNMKFIIHAKHLSADFDFIDREKIQSHDIINPDGSIHRFRFVNSIRLNSAHLDLKVNMLDYSEISNAGEVLRRFTWVTDIHLTNNTVYQVMQGGRSRWKIENETFNTLKNQGYQFEHNFGHGYKNLCTVFGHLMFLAFLLDQIQQRCCTKFQAALLEAKSRIRFWSKVRHLALEIPLGSWHIIYGLISHRNQYRISVELVLDSS